MSGHQPTVLLARQLIDGTGAEPKYEVAVWVKGGVIAEIHSGRRADIPADARVVDLRSCSILPGLIDAHMHFWGIPSDEIYRLATESEAARVLRAANQARRMLAAGITSARCLGSSIGPSLRRALIERHVEGPRLVAAGEFICSTGGTFVHQTLGIPDGSVDVEMVADGTAGLRAAVRRRFWRGANVIKIGLSRGSVDDRHPGWGDDPSKQIATYTDEEVRALTDEAHRYGLRVSAHCIGDESVRQALSAGVDSIEHGFGIDGETRRLLARSRTFVTTTFSVQHFSAAAAKRRTSYPDWHREIIDQHAAVMARDFGAGLQAGVHYVLGSDLIGDPTHPQDQAAVEFELAVNNGMSPMQAIVAGTKSAAEVLGTASTVGTIEVGKEADIIGVANDPLEDITALQRVAFVMQGGRVVRNHASTEVSTCPAPTDSSR